MLIKAWLMLLIFLESEIFYERQVYVFDDMGLSRALPFVSRSSIKFKGADNIFGFFLHHGLAASSPHTLLAWDVQRINADERPDLHTNRQK